VFFSSRGRFQRSVANELGCLGLILRMIDGGRSGHLQAYTP